MAMPTLTSIIFGSLLAVIMVIGMSNFYVGTYQSYHTNESLLHGNTSLNQSRTTFIDELTSLADFSGYQANKWLSEIPGIGGYLNSGANVLWAIGVFLQVPSKLGALLTNSILGTNIALPAEVNAMIGAIIIFILVVGLIRVLTQRGEV